MFLSQYIIIKTIIFIFLNIFVLINSTLNLACIGDSITFGFHGKSYPFILEALIKNNLFKGNLNISNYGSSPSTVQKGTYHKNIKSSIWDYNKVNLALDSKPNIVLILFGTDDSKLSNWKNIDNFKNDYYDLINKFINLSNKPKIYIMTPPPYYASKPHYEIQGNIINKELPNIISDIAKEKNIEIIDIFNSLGGEHLNIPTAFFNNNHRNKIIGDGFYPNQKGYTIMANTIYNKIKQDINKFNEICPFKPLSLTEQHNGGWLYTEELIAKEHVIFDVGFGDALISYLGTTSLYDIGAGVGQFENFLLERNHSIEVSAFDGGNNIETMWGKLTPVRDGPNHIIPKICWIDASVPTTLPPKKWVLSVEVGEHIVKSKESIFIDNLVNWADDGIILTWALRRQGGHQHVNEQNNDHIISEMNKRGFIYDEDQSSKFRKSVKWWQWLRKTIMVFHREIK